MTMFISLLSGGWKYLAALAGIVAAIAASYFGGKKVGNVQTQAKADVKAEKVKSEQVAAVAKQQADDTVKANDIRQSNAALSDTAARNKLRNSQFNSND